MEAVAVLIIIILFATGSFN